ncbi:fimbrial protein [Serratia quinivorans]|uniref:fimbrial protein n=1 Tax=Serratia quinivorans TaxID=137545 RepID=UPI003981BB7A
MKKILLALLMPTLMGSAFSSFAEGGTPQPVKKVTVDGGKINFTGSIVAAPCAVDSESSRQSVDLGQVATNKLVSKGDSSAAVPFTIKLVGCDLTADISDPSETANYTKASITFNGTTNDDDSTLALSGSSGGSTVAKNVGIQILQNNKALKVDGSTATTAIDLLNGNNELPFSVAYVATADNTVAGIANSTVNFRVTYE